MSGADKAAVNTDKGREPQLRATRQWACPPPPPAAGWWMLLSAGCMHFARSTDSRSFSHHCIYHRCTLVCCGWQNNMTESAKWRDFAFSVLFLLFFLVMWFPGMTKKFILAIATFLLHQLFFKYPLFATDIFLHLSSSSIPSKPIIEPSWSKIQGNDCEAFPEKNYICCSATPCCCLPDLRGSCNLCTIARRSLFASCSCKTMAIVSLYTDSLTNSKVFVRLLWA